jgi:hypothetical protein
MARVRFLTRRRKTSKKREYSSFLVLVLKKIHTKHFAIASMILVCGISILILSSLLIKENSAEQSEDNAIHNTESKTGELFLTDIRSKTPITLKTSSRAYDFVHQYVTNGGNIYEIYDYIHSHLELGFLNEAESMYPDVFTQIEKRQLPHTYSDRGMYAYVAYLEVLYLHSYDDITIVGELAYEYSKFAYYQEMIGEDKRAGKSLNYPDYSSIETEALKERARRYIEIANTLAKDIMADSFLYSMIATPEAFESFVAYASALRFYETFDSNFSNDPTAKTVFEFATAYALKTHLSEVYLPVYLKNASTQILFKSPDITELQSTLSPFYSNQIKINDLPFVKKMFAAKYTPSVSRFGDLNILSYKNLQKLGLLVPEFKTWLIENGWTENDFEEAATNHKGS